MLSYIDPGAGSMILQALAGFQCRSVIARMRSPEDAKAIAAQPPVFILVVPLFHVTGCVSVLLSCVSGGFELVMMYKWDPERALELIERERVTNFVGVPTQSWDMLEHPRFAEFDTSSLVNVGGGGAPAPPELVRRLEALMVVADAKHSLLVSGTGDVIQPTDGIIGIGSGGSLAVAAAQALVAHSSLSASEIVRKALEIAGGIDIYTNQNIVVEELSCQA